MIALDNPSKLSKTHHTFDILDERFLSTSKCVIHKENSRRKLRHLHAKHINVRLID